MTRPSSSRPWRHGCGAVRRTRSSNRASSTSSAPWVVAHASRRRRRASGSVDPVGTWTVGAIDRDLRVVGQQIRPKPLAVDGRADRGGAAGDERATERRIAGILDDDPTALAKPQPTDHPEPDHGPGQDDDLFGLAACRARRAQMRGDDGPQPRVAGRIVDLATAAAFGDPPELIAEEALQRGPDGETTIARPRATRGRGEPPLLQPAAADERRSKRGSVCIGRWLVDGRVGPAARQGTQGRQANRIGPRSGCPRAEGLPRAARRAAPARQPSRTRSGRQIALGGELLVRRGDRQATHVELRREHSHARHPLPGSQAAPRGSPVGRSSRPVGRAARARPIELDRHRRDIGGGDPSGRSPVSAWGRGGFTRCRNGTLKTWLRGRAGSGPTATLPAGPPATGSGPFGVACTPLHGATARRRLEH